MAEIGEERLKLLVCNYVDGNMTLEDSEELNAYGVLHPQVWLLIARLQDKDQLAADLEEMRHLDVNAALEDAWSMIKAEEKKSFFKSTGWKMMASLAIILGAVVGIMSLLRHKPDNNMPLAQSTVRNTPPDIHGGGNKAILTLANGQMLTLQDLPTGNLATQYGSRLVKTDSILSYIPRLELESDAVQYNTLSTPRTGQYGVILPDGSRVWLNSASSLSYPTAFNGRAREVTLTGEAYFEIAGNASQPFHIHVDSVTVNVLGTSLSIRAYSDEGKTVATLLKGKIGLKDARHEEWLSANEQISIDGKKSWKKLKGVEAESVLAWKNGAFSFAHADIPTVMRELSRWYGVDVEIKVPDSQYYYEGEFSREAGLSAILDYLTNDDVHFRREGNRVIVLP